MPENLSETLERLRAVAAEPISVARSDEAWSVLVGLEAEIGDLVWEYVHAHRLLHTPALAALPSDDPLGMDRAVPGEGLGALRRGLGMAQVKVLLGEPEEVSSYEAGQVYWSYHTRAIQMMFSDGVLATVFLFSGRRGGYEPANEHCCHATTPGGLTMASTYDYDYR